MICQLNGILRTKPEGQQETAITGTTMMGDISKILECHNKLFLTVKSRGRKNT